MIGRVFLFGVVVMFSLSHTSGVSSIVTINSCTRDRLSVTLTGALDGGVIYIRDSNCRLVTSTGSSIYSFNLSSCNHTWGRPFRLVVQKNPAYFTQNDTTLPVQCTVDLSRITDSVGINMAPVNEDTLRRVSTKPAVEMSLLSNGYDVTGRTLTLNDVISLNLRLLDQFKDDFDIRVSSCHTSTIPLLASGCPTDPALFPGFTRISKGYLRATFNTFIPTDRLGHMTSSLTITCTVDVCLRTCSDVDCTGRAGSNHGSMQHSNLSKEQLHVNASVSVSEENEYSFKGSRIKTHLETGVMVFIAVFLATFIVTAMCLIAIRCRKHDKNRRKSFRSYGYTNKKDLGNDLPSQTEIRTRTAQQRTEIEESYQYYYGENEAASLSDNSEDLHYHQFTRTPVQFV